ncbi:MAG: Na+/H+ antiporter NhaC family protein, partial [Oscillospiraceae bacterium]
GTDGGTILTIGIAACLSGAVCGDHCSPISDTTILASTGAQCFHLNHVKTQLPYALTVAAVAGVGFAFTGIMEPVFNSRLISALVGLAFAFGLMFLVLWVLGTQAKKKEAAKVAAAK